MKIAFFPILFFVCSAYTASGQQKALEEQKEIIYEIYSETCKGIRCEKISIKSGKVTIALEPESKDFSWGVKTENFKESETEFKLILHLSKQGRDTYRIESSITKTRLKMEPVYSSASVAVDGYKKGLKLTLQPFEGAGPQTRVSLILN